MAPQNPVSNLIKRNLRSGNRSSFFKNNELTVLKLEMLSAIIKSLKGKFSSQEDKANNKETLLKELSGSWSDISEELANDIYNNRVNSTREISF